MVRRRPRLEMEMCRLTHRQLNVCWTLSFHLFSLHALLAIFNQVVMVQILIEKRRSFLSFQSFICMIDKMSKRCDILLLYKRLYLLLLLQDKVGLFVRDLYVKFLNLRTLARNGELGVDKFRKVKKIINILVWLGKLLVNFSDALSGLFSFKGGR